MDKNAITEFEKEVSIMSTLQHESIVSLVGLCTETMPLYIIMGKFFHSRNKWFILFMLEILNIGLKLYHYYLISKLKGCYSFSALA